MRVVATTAILVILALQIFAGFYDTGRWGWPFLAYRMYEHVHEDGSRLQLEVSTYAVMKDGNEVRLEPEDLDMRFWAFRTLVVQPVRNDDIEKLNSLILHLCREFNGQIVGIRIEDEGLAVGRNGLIDNLPPEEIASQNISCQA